MRRRLRQNAAMFPKSISDVQYIYPTSDIQYPTSATARARARARARTRARARARARAKARTRAGISDVRYRYRTSDIGTLMSDIGTRMSDIGTRMSDIGTYRYRTSDIYIRRPIDFGNIGGILS